MWDGRLVMPLIGWPGIPGWMLGYFGTRLQACNSLHPPRLGPSEPFCSLPFLDLQKKREREREKGDKPRENVKKERHRERERERALTAYGWLTR